MKKSPMPNEKWNSVLSPLEEDVLRILWASKQLKVRDIYNSLKGKRKVALSSVAVILDRLHDRKIVGRDMETARGGVRYIYFPKGNKQEFERSVVEKAVNTLLDRFGNTASSYFNERFSK